MRDDDDLVDGYFSVACILCISIVVAAATGGIYIVGRAIGFWH